MTITSKKFTVVLIRWYCVQRTGHLNWKLQNQWHYYWILFTRISGESRTPVHTGRFFVTLSNKSKDLFCTLNPWNVIQPYQNVQNRLVFGQLENPKNGLHYKIKVQISPSKKKSSIFSDKIRQFRPPCKNDIRTSLYNSFQFWRKQFGW